MSYNRNQGGNAQPAVQQEPVNNGGFAKEPASTMPSTKKEFIPSKPCGSIKIQKVGAEGSLLLTGIWKETSKAGKTYYRGKGIDDGATYLVFLNDEQV